MPFTLDTRGGVIVPGEGLDTFWRFDSLTPFAQGYVEAMFASSDLPLAWDEVSPGCVAERDAGFRHLAPASLSRIIGDCEAMLEVMRAAGSAFPETPKEGRIAWDDRQADNWIGHTFPPLTVSLGEDGLIYFGGPSQ